MDDIVIKVTANEAGIADLNKQLDGLRAKNKELEDQMASSHGKQVNRQKEIKDGNDKLAFQFEDLGKKIVAAFAVEQLIEFGKESVKAFAEAEEASNRLKFAITSVNKEGIGAFKALDEQAEKLSKSLNTLFTPTQIRNAQAQLAVVGLTTDQIRKLTPAILNLATASGKTLEEATSIATNAVIGHGKELTKLGFTFNDTGSKTKNYTALLKDLSKFEGAAEEKSHTMAGALDEQKNKLEELKVTLGEGLSNGLIGLASTFDDIWHNIKQSTLELLGFDTAADKAAQKAKKDAEDLGSKTDEMLSSMKTANANSIEAYETQIRGITDLSTASVQKVMAIQALQNDLRKKNADIDAELTIRNTKISADATQKKEEEDKKAAEELKKLWEKYYADLKKIIQQDADDKTKFNIDLIKDETEKKLAQNDAEFSKEKTALVERTTELQEIYKAGINSKDILQKNAAIKAKAELDNANTDIELATKVHEQKRLQIIADAKIQEIKLTEDAQKEIERHQNAMQGNKIDSAEQQLKDQLDKKIISQKSYNEQMNALEELRLQDQLKHDLESDQITIDSIQKQIDEQKTLGNDISKLQADLIKAENKQLEDAAKDGLAIQKKADEEQVEEHKEFAEQVKKIAESVNEIAQTALTAANDVANSNINVINTQLDAQARAIDVQKTLAEKGLDNDLAFEEKRADELEKAKLKEQQKLKKIKELETFLNALANFAEKDPKTALPKALALLAATKAAEAVYAEDGGIIGQIGSRSMIGAGMSRRHKSGNDVLLHAEKGEGILSVKEMNNLGIGNFNMLKSMLKTPFSEKLIPNKGGTIVVQDNSALLERLDSLEKTIKNKKEVSIDFDEMNQWIKTEVENGVKKVIKHVNPNARRKF